MERQKGSKQRYLTPRVQIVKVTIECGIAVQVSARVVMYPDWDEVEIPVGTNPGDEGGDLFLFY